MCEAGCSVMSDSLKVCRHGPLAGTLAGRWVATAGLRV